MIEAPKVEQVDALAREMLAIEYERAGSPDIAAAFRAGSWTCHDHPAYRAMVVALSTESERTAIRDEGAGG